MIEVLAAFDRQATSHERTDSTLCMFMSSVPETVIDRFVSPGGWSDDAIRAELLAFLVHAPDDDLEMMLESARKEVAWIDEFETQQAQDRARPGEAN